MQNRAKSVDAEIANTEENQGSNVLDLRNAYQAKPEMECNPGKSVRDLSEIKMYAELKQMYTPQQLKYFREDLWKHYRIREHDYAAMFDKQSGNCDVCKTNQAELTRRLSVDHCHTSGEIRGLLCDNCNPAVGFVKESIERCEQLIAYLKKFKK